MGHGPWFVDKAERVMASGKDWRDGAGGGTGHLSHSLSKVLTLSQCGATTLEPLMTGSRRNWLGGNNMLGCRPGEQGEQERAGVRGFLPWTDTALATARLIASSHLNIIEAPSVADPIAARIFSLNHD